MRALGRSRVAAHVGEGTEQRSDIHGIVYISLGNDGAWCLQLARELNAAGLAVDLNHLV